MYLGHTISNADTTPYHSEHSGIPTLDIRWMVAVPNSVQLTLLMVTWSFTRRDLHRCRGFEKQKFSWTASQEAIKKGILKYTLIVPRYSRRWQTISMVLIMQHVVMCNKNPKSETRKHKCRMAFHQAVHRAIIRVKTWRYCVSHQMKCQALAKYRLTFCKELQSLHVILAHWLIEFGRKRSGMLDDRYWERLRCYNRLFSRLDGFACILWSRTDHLYQTNEDAEFAMSQSIWGAHSTVRMGSTKYQGLGRGQRIDLAHLTVDRASWHFVESAHRTSDKPALKIPIGKSVV